MTAAARVLGYGALLAAGALMLAWVDYQQFARTRVADLALGLAALGFLALGLFAGWRLFGRQPPRAEGNPAAVAALGISGRELEVLRALAADRPTRKLRGRWGCRRTP